MGKVLLNSSTAKPVTFKRWLVASDAVKCADEAVYESIQEVGAGCAASHVLPGSKQPASCQALCIQACFLCMWVHMWRGTCWEGQMLW